jgi:hypothetical protein
MNRRLLALVLLPSIFLPGCIFAVAVSPSSAENANIVVLIGRWSGTTSDSAGSAAGVWALAQNGTALTGVMATCSMVIDGEGTMSDDGGKITGSYTGSLAGMIGPQRSCGGTLSRGTFSMAR